MATIADRILGALGSSGPLDDDVLASRLGIARQSINQAARRLESHGAVRRYVGRHGKIVNVVVDSPPSVATSVASLARSMRSRSGVISEDEVKSAIFAHLEAQGYEVQVAWGRSRSIDIEARRNTERLVIEAKGEVPAAGPQHVNYFLGALGELLQRMNDPVATYGLAVPDHKQYRGLVSRLPTLARQRLGLVVYFVSRDGDSFTVQEDRIPVPHDHGPADG